MLVYHMKVCFLISHSYYDKFIAMPFKSAIGVLLVQLLDNGKTYISIMHSKIISITISILINNDRILYKVSEFLLF